MKYGPQSIARALACAIFLSQSANATSSFLAQINCPRDLSPSERPILIAVVDDGMRLSHESIAPFLWNNPDEIPNNRIDDDGNGFVDDLHGWDVSDQDSDVLPAPPHQADLYHGTHVAGIITEIVRHAFGEQTQQAIRILPIKCISDQAPPTYLKEGFRGIEAALEYGADIIVCAWGVAHLSPDEQALLNRVEQRGTILIASTGNLPEEREQFPAAHPAAIAISGLNPSGQKMSEATFGSYIDLLAPGINISGADIASDTAYSNRSGTSYAAAIVAGSTAVLMTQYPEASSEEIKAMLLNASSPVATENPLHQARLGAGRINLEKAIRQGIFLPVGVVKTSKNILPLKGSTTQEWNLVPEGHIAGFRFHVSSQGTTSGTVHFFKEALEDAPFRSKEIKSGVADTFYVPGAPIRIRFEPQRSGTNNTQTLLHYTAEPINLSTLYCSGTTYIEKECSLSDNSGAHPYAPNTDAKWMITAPKGKLIQFTFSEFDTEPRTDKIYFFNGSGTHEKIMAVFSGSELPPVFTSWSNQALMWFVTDGQNQGDGWNAEIKFIDAADFEQQ